MSYIFNNKKEEWKRNYIDDKEKNINKIKIIIDNKFESFENLFKGCYCIETITFKKFYRNNIYVMSSMFEGCLSLRELNLNIFNTDNIILMNRMFCGCHSLIKLNLSNFNTNNVK